MSLQTEVFTYGSLSSNVFKYYALELTLTENSVSQDENTSEIAYTLKLKTGSNNRFDGRINCTLKLNGSQVATVEKKQMFDYKKTFTLLTGTATVTHSADGTLNMPIAVVVNTAESNPYSPDDTTINWSWELTTIPRASSITSAEAVTLGNPCSVKWTPNSTSFRYKLEFSIGDWKHTTSAIHPNKTSAYTYTGYTLPLEIAEQITDSAQDTMTVNLYTYSDSECKNSIGSDSETFTVTVPDNADTKPTVTMKLSAVSPFEGLYVQGLSKVQAEFSAEAKLGAKIKSYSINVEGVDYQNPYLSNALKKDGISKIIGYAKDSRGIAGSAEQTIEVLPYHIPKLLDVEVYRCTSDGQPADDGEYLKIKATRDYAPVVDANGVQHNFCCIQYQYKAENSDKYSEPKTILEAGSLESNEIITEALLNATFSKEIAYSVQIIAVDTSGQRATETVSIASEYVFRHKRAGGKGLGLGGYCEEDDLLEVHWNQRIRKNLRIDGMMTVGGKNLIDLIYPVGSIYMSVSASDPALLFGGTWARLQDRFLLAASDNYKVESTGGEAEHVLTVEEIPSHKHTVKTMVQGHNGWSEKTINEHCVMHGNSNGDFYAPPVTKHVAEVYSGSTVNVGGGNAHNNMPPYLAVYMYKRIA